MLDTGTASNQELAEANRRDTISALIKSRSAAQKEGEEKALLTGDAHMVLSTVGYQPEQLTVPWYFWSGTWKKRGIKNNNLISCK